MALKLFVFFCFASLFANISAYSLLHHFSHAHNHQNNEETSLVLLHVLFRHGNRTADSAAELYPNDPYLNKTYFPIGLGQLTNAGKEREYSIGKALRERYNGFIGNTYYPQIVDARSTDYNRTKVSLLLSLAGLFPPRGEEVWNRWLTWQPIPYNYWPRDNDKILMGISCPKYIELYQQVRNSPKLQAEFAKYKKEFDYISQNSGLNVTSFQEVYNLYFGLSTEEEFGLKLPDWTKRVWPETIINLSIKEYYVSMATTELRKLAAGYLLQKIIEDTKAKINEDKHTQFKKKIYMYSAHENNVAELLLLLDVFTPHIPNYGAYVVLEVHRINGVYGIKIYYENYTGGKIKLLKIPACEEFCPLDKFIRLFEEYLPEESFCGKK